MALYDECLVKDKNKTNLRSLGCTVAGPDVLGASPGSSWLPSFPFGSTVRSVLRKLSLNMCLPAVRVVSRGKGGVRIPVFSLRGSRGVVGWGATEAFSFSTSTRPLSQPSGPPRFTAELKLLRAWSRCRMHQPLLTRHKRVQSTCRFCAWEGSWSAAYGHVFKDCGFEFGTAAGAVDILDAKQKRSTGGPGDLRRKKGAIGMAQMQATRGTGREACNGLSHHSGRIRRLEVSQSA